MMKAQPERPSRLRILGERCLYSGACAVVAPATFMMGRSSACVAQRADVKRAQLAADICPRQAIAGTRASTQAEVPALRSADVLAAPLHGNLFNVAERCRWKMTDIPFEEIDHAAVTPNLISVVRQIAESEMTTYTATRQFLDVFVDDVDLTSWMSVWFYEESKHPRVLLRWLRAVGHEVDAEEVRRARVTAPFMSSRVGTLVTNVISEMVAATSYARMAVGVAEPVLRIIAARLSADEARHAASFYGFAERYIGDDNERRRDALKVLFMWLRDGSRVGHPVSAFHGRPAVRTESSGCFEDLGLSLEVAQQRICKVVGRLAGVELASADEIPQLIKEMR